MFKSKEPPKTKEEIAKERGRKLDNDIKNAEEKFAGIMSAAVGDSTEEKDATAAVSGNAERVTTSGGDKGRILSAEDAALEAEVDQEEENENKMGMLEKIQKAMVEAFVDYGPPYTTGVVPPDAIVNECAEFKINLLEVHSLLNQGADPNFRDPEDLYYTAMHWCARNCHLLALKMCRRAKCDFNLTNELGQSVLGMACLMRQPPDKYKNQLKMIKYILKEGGDINSRDKGGFSSLDFACMNNDINVIKILLEHGADVMRENNHIVAKRRPLLKIVTDPDCYRLIYERVSEIKARQDEERIRLEELAVIAAEKERLRLRLEDIDRKREAAAQIRQQKAAESYQRALVEEREKKVKEEMQKMTKTSDEARHALGGWKREPTGQWTFHSRVYERQDDKFYHESKKQVLGIRDKYRFEVFNDRWKSITGGKELEVKWTKSDIFDSSILGMSADEEPLALIKARAPVLTVTAEDVDFRDENDDLLSNDIDIDDLLHDLS